MVQRERARDGESSRPPCSDGGPRFPGLLALRLVANSPGAVSAVGGMRAGRAPDNPLRVYQPDSGGSSSCTPSPPRPRQAQTSAYPSSEVNLMPTSPWRRTYSSDGTDAQVVAGRQLRKQTTICRPLVHLNPERRQLPVGRRAAGGESQDSHSTTVVLGSARLTDRVSALFTHPWAKERGLASYISPTPGGDLHHRRSGTSCARPLAGERPIARPRPTLSADVRPSPWTSPTEEA